MKYLKRFNEELNPNVYKNAAKKLDKIGHKRRAKSLTEWAEVMQKRKDEEYENEIRERLSQFPVFEIDVRTDSWSKGSTRHGDSVFTGNFYIDFSFEPDMFNDQLWEVVSGSKPFRYPLNLHFDFSIYPADEETKSNLESLHNDGKWIGADEPYHNIYYGTWLYLKLSEKDKSIDESFINGGYDMGLEQRERDVFLLANRREALKFKRLLIDAFEGKNDFGKSRWATKGVADKVKECFKSNEKEFNELRKNPDDRGHEQFIEWFSNNDESPIKEEHYQKVVDAIKGMSLNILYRD